MFAIIGPDVYAGGSPTPNVKTYGIARSKAEAAQDGFATFNNCPHLCVEITEPGCSTITVKTPQGKLVTFGFMCIRSDEAHVECIDIQQHHTDGPQADCSGTKRPAQSVCIRSGETGEVLYAIGKTTGGKPKATMTTISLTNDKPRD